MADGMIKDAVIKDPVPKTGELWVHGPMAPTDALLHGGLAEAIARHIAAMPSGSVISIQGSWGRGKTDVLSRTCELFEKRAEAGDGPRPIWLNPWQYGRPDLIAPVVIELLSRTRGQAKNEDWFRATAATLLHASNAMAFKALSLFVPFGSVAEAAQEPVDALISRLMDPGAGQQTDVDDDPVRAMARRFRDLVERVREVQGLPAGPPLLVCVDDIDRCLPDQQIAMLEAIHFLTTAGANCAFLVAIDPLLVQQAAITHYRTDAIDINQYLDKLFMLRVNLTGLRPPQVKKLVAAQLTGEAARVLQDGLDTTAEVVGQAFQTVFFVPELANPRLLHRTFQRLGLAAAANAQEPRPLNGVPVDALVTWCAIAERWPQLRQMLQASRSDKWQANLTAVCGHYGYWGGRWADPGEAHRPARLAEAEVLLSRLPGPLRQPDLGYFLFQIVQTLRYEHLLEILQDTDEALVSFGL